MFEEFLTLEHEEGAANLVRAAAVIRRPRALSGIIGRKESVGGVYCRGLKLPAQPGICLRNVHARGCERCAELTV